jgi:hypothetical protein
MCAGANAADSIWWQPYTTDAQTMGLWHFDEMTQTSTTFIDSSGLGHNGIRSYPDDIPTTIGDGKWGKAIQGGGSPWSCTVPDHSAFYTYGGSFTIEAWIKPTAADVTNGTLAGIVNKGGSSQFNFGLYCGQLAADCTTSVKYSAVLGGPTLSADTWYHIAAAYETNRNGTSQNFITIYLNGGIVADSAVPGDFGYNADKPLALGVWDNSGNQYSNFKGVIDEVRYSDGIRTFATPEPATLLLIAFGATIIRCRKS